MDSTLSALTASTPGTAGLLYAVQGGADRKLSMTAAGATLLEAANAAAQLTALGAATLGANTYTGAQTIGGALALGTTPTAYGTLTNTTAAAAGAQQVSPSMVWTGQGWKTNATAASQQVDFRAYVLPVQGTAAPSGTLTFQSSINGGAYSNALAINNELGATITSTTSLGNVLTLTSTYGSTTLTRGSNVLSFSSAITISGGFIEINSSGGSISYLYTKAAATLQMGADAAGVVDQTFKACDRITSDGVGANLTIAGGRNRGASDGGSVIIQTSPAAGAGVTGTLTTRVTVNADGITTFAKPAVLPGYTVAGLPATAANGAVQGAHAFVTDATAPTYLGALTGGGAVVCPVFYNGSAWVSH